MNLKHDMLLLHNLTLGYPHSVWITWQFFSYLFFLNMKENLHIGFVCSRCPPHLHRLIPAPRGDALAIR